MTPECVMCYPTLCAQPAAARLSQAGGRENPPSFLLPLHNFVPYPAPWKASKETSTTVTTQSLLDVLIWILFELLELTLAWTVLKTLTGVDWLDPAVPFVGGASPALQAFILQTKRNITLQQIQPAAWSCKYLLRGKTLLWFHPKEVFFFFLILRRGRLKTKQETWNYCCKLSLFISGFQAWRKQNLLSGCVTVKSKKKNKPNSTQTKPKTELGVWGWSRKRVVGSASLGVAGWSCKICGFR